MDPSSHLRPGELLLVARPALGVCARCVARRKGRSPLRCQVAPQWGNDEAGRRDHDVRDAGGFGPWELESALDPVRLRPRGRARRGVAPLLVPPSDDGVEEILDAVDGLIFSGGSDLDPELYGQEPHPGDERDRAGARQRRARRCSARALDRDLPVLAICRGSQVLNIALGGDLVQHLPDEVGHDGHKETPGVFADHDVEIEPGTRLASLLGERVAVKSHHHQGFARLGEGLTASARDEDGRVEALEAPDRGSPSACCGIPRSERTCACSRRSSPRPPRTARYAARSSVVRQAVVLHENGYH